MRQFLIFDARYHTDMDRAIVMDVCDTRAEAEEVAPDYGEDCVIVETEWPVPEKE